MRRIFFYLMILSLMAGPVLAQESQTRPFELDGTEWKITLTSEQGKTENDTLVFKNKKVVSVNLEKQKFDSTNYTLSVKDDGTTVFETMQTKGDDVVFWHGVVQDKTLRGICSVHVKGQVNDFSISGTLVSGALNLQEPPKKVEEPAATKEPEAAKPAKSNKE